MSLQVDCVIDGYELLDVVSSSRTRVVYRVRNVAANRIEQMHVMPRSLRDDQERAERFVREIRILASISHPNIVRFYYAVVVDGQMAMTTELLEGVSLTERLQLGPLAPAEALKIMRGILSAVSFAHEHGIIHREITPDNILLTPDEDTKLAGFTFAKSASDYDLTRVGTIVGDFNYMPPEQVRATGVTDARSDLYSLGAVLFTMVTGKPPFHSMSQFDVMMAHVSTPPPRPSESNPELGDKLDAVILKVLAKEPDARYQTASQFQHALDTLDYGVEPAASIELPTSASDASASWEKRPAPRTPKVDPGDMASVYIWPAVVLAAVFAAVVLTVLFAPGWSSP